jgi:hypothetical protein
VEVLTIDAIDRAIADLNGQLASLDDQVGEAAAAPESAG